MSSKLETMKTPSLLIVDTEKGEEKTQKMF